jgi:hypothetical protein
VKNKILLCSVFLIALSVSCAKNPFTGKNTLALVPNSEILPSAFAQYSTFLKENQLLQNHLQTTSKNK